MESQSCCLADKFSVKTYTKGHSKGIAGFNLTSSSQSGFTSYLNYQFEFGDSFHQNLVSARFEWNW